jgi:hypothetical protein
MLWVLSLAGLTGLLCGCLFRAPALIFLSFISFGGAFVLELLTDATLGHAAITAFFLTAALQCGYLVGAVLCHLRQQLRVSLGHSFRRAPEAPLPHR